jgi:hypothetical protein
MTDVTSERLPLRLWRINDWLAAAGHPFSRAKLYSEIRKGRIDARTAGDCTLIATSPAAYFASLPRGLGPAFGRGKRGRITEGCAAP